MDLHIYVFLLLALFTTGQCLDCYECLSMTGSCADQKVIKCPELQSCFSSTVVTQHGYSNTTTSKIKGCAPYCVPTHTNFNGTDVSFVCCNADLCNARDDQVTEPSVDSNGHTCYTCDIQDCSKKIVCSGSQDHCFTATVNYGISSTTFKGCISKAACDITSSYPNSPAISRFSAFL